MPWGEGREKTGRIMPLDRFIVSPRMGDALSGGAARKGSCECSDYTGKGHRLQGLYRRADFFAFSRLPGEAMKRKLVDITVKWRKNAE